MRSAAHFVMARRLLALAGVVAIGACSNDVAGVTPTGSNNSVTGGPTSGNPASSDTTGGAPQGEWHLATIRGVVVGINAQAGARGDTALGVNPITVSNAKVEIHKVGLNSTSAAGDTASYRLQDLGVVATVTTDASGKFEYVLSDPIVVKSGQSSPMITYQLTVTPPSGLTIRRAVRHPGVLHGTVPGRPARVELLPAPQEIAAGSRAERAESRSARRRSRSFCSSSSADESRRTSSHSVGARHHSERRRRQPQLTTAELPRT